MQEQRRKERKEQKVSVRLFSSLSLPLFLLFYGGGGDGSSH
jgi:hypothetical protein